MSVSSIALASKCSTRSGANIVFMYAALAGPELQSTPPGLNRMPELDDYSAGRNFRARLHVEHSAMSPSAGLDLWAANTHHLRVPSSFAAASPQATPDVRNSVHFRQEIMGSLRMLRAPPLQLAGME